MRGRRAHEHGQVAIVVAVCLVALMGISAFAIDLGLAYSNKRQLQTAADAAAAAAAQTYVGEPGNCPFDLSPDPTLANAARAVGREVMFDNHPDATEVPPTAAEPFVTCDSGRLQVIWRDRATTEVGLGKVFGVDPITAGRTAVAEVGVAGEVTQLRPYAICSADLPASLPSGPVRIDYTGADPAAPCPAGLDSDSWWTTTCPNAPPGVDLQANTVNGCGDPVALVQGQAPTSGDPVGLSTRLVPACPGAGASDADCLAAQPADLSDSASASGVWKAWRDEIVGEQILFPVVCGSPQCAPAAVVEPGTATTAYPVQSFVAATVCGYHWGGMTPSMRADDVGVVPVDDPCFGTPDVDDDNTADNYLILGFEQVQVSGSLVPSSCALDGDGCDRGVRIVTLVE